MKRGIFGIVLLAVLLGAGMFVAGDMAQRHTPIQAALRVAALLAEQNQWEDAEIYQQRAESLWKKSWCLDAAAADHTPMEEIDGSFLRLRVYLREQEKTDFTAEIRALERRVQAMTEAHTASWWNVL